MHTLLIVDDDRDLFRLLDDYFSGGEYVCRHAPDADAAFERLRSETPDAIILDVMLPGMDGFEILRRLRSDASTAGLPVLMLSARGEEADKVTGLELGADDYLAKPFSARELAARVHALMRRSGRAPAGDTQAQDVLHLDDLAINRAALTVTAASGKIDVTASELRLLEIFAENPGKVVDRTELYQTLFGHPPFYADRSLDMLVSRVRKKLGPRADGGERIRAARGQGYVFLMTEGEQ